MRCGSCVSRHEAIRQPARGVAAIERFAREVSQVKWWKIAALVLAAVAAAVSVPLGLRKLKEEQEQEPEVGAY